jgi:hypothetical protein
VRRDVGVRGCANEVGDAKRAQLVSCVPEDGGEFIVGFDEAALVVHLPDTEWHLFEDQAETILRFLERRHVDAVADQRERRARSGAQQPDFAQHPAVFAAMVAEPVLEAARCLLARLAHRFVDAIEIVGMNAASPFTRIRLQRLRVVAQFVADVLADEDDAVRRGDLEGVDDGRGRVEQVPQVGAVRRALARVRTALEQQAPAAIPRRALRGGPCPLRYETHATARGVSTAGVTRRPKLQRGDGPGQRGPRPRSSGGVREGCCRPQGFLRPTLVAAEGAAVTVPVTSAPQDDRKDRTAPRVVYINF